MSDDRLRDADNPRYGAPTVWARPWRAPDESGEPLLPRALAAVREAEARYESLLACLSVFVFEIAPDGTILRLNEAAARLTRDDPATLRGTNFWTRFFPHARLMEGYELRRQCAQGNLTRYPVQLTAYDGTLVPLELDTANQYTADGRLARIIGIGVDRQAPAETMASQVRALQHLVETRDLFLQTISHDLRIPLTVVHGHAQMIEQQLRETGLLAGYAMHLDAILRSVRRMNVMIEDLVDSARLEGGQFKLHCQPVALADYLGNLLTRLRGMVEADRVEADVPPDLPPIAADPDRLERIIINLLTNALKYSPPASRVRIEACPRERDVVITVIDQGVGIPPEDIPHLFTRFFRGRGERQADGLGLGLYITRMLVDAHGGAITVESTPQHGSRFILTLPRADGGDA